ncbi:MAG: transketolase [Xanthomonadales bacterium]|nr:transketolase [Xanthomonadales bacterium]
MPSRKQLANAIRALSMDAIQKANSGHPGAPMGMADIAEVLWRDYHKHNPANPGWHDRDRFVLSNGHASMLIYSLLHLSGYDLSIQDLKDFRQFHSKTAGHPEYGHTPGVETTTGPLGQGIANAVGMALSEKVLAKRFNREGFSVVDHHTWVFLGDGCLMEGVSHEVCSLAGTLGLGKLVMFWDDNNISIDGEVGGWFSDNTPERFRAYGWQVIEAVDGYHSESISAAIDAAKAESNKPTLICCKTIIGYGASNKQGTSGVHGAPLGDAEIAVARKTLGWDYPAFEIPEDYYSAWDARAAGSQVESQWDRLFTSYQTEHPKLAAEFSRRMAGKMPDNWTEFADNIISEMQQGGADVATRKASQMALNAFGPALPELIGGSADLAGSNLTIWDRSVDVLDNTADGNYIYFGVREFGMTAICNGISLHGGFTPYSATFLVFADYARNAVRMSALLPCQNIHVYTHDSIGLGEDGPTHQPVEHIASLRIIPSLDVWRPCDTVESAVAWRAALENKTQPNALIFTRQTLPHQQRNNTQLAAISRGGYVLKDVENPAALIIATGSEIALAMDAAAELEATGTAVRVISMPNADLFLRQDSAWQDAVLPPKLRARVAIEAGVSDYWYRFVGDAGKIIGMDQFGASAPADVLFEAFGFTTENVVAAVNDSIVATN